MEDARQRSRAKTGIPDGPMSTPLEANRASDAVSENCTVVKEATPSDFASLHVPRLDHLLHLLQREDSRCDLFVFFRLSGACGEPLRAKKSTSTSSQSREWGTESINLRSTLRSDPVFGQQFPPPPATGLRAAPCARHEFHQKFGRPSAGIAG